ncbi:MAG TPA: S8 family serine peptidase [Meiothermus sp.]|nr:S8 family serine peptidase [Meiothermus sp.]
MRWIGLIIIGLLASCNQQPPASPGMALYPDQAARGELVTVSLKGISADGATVLVGGLQAAVRFKNEQTLVFAVPKDVQAGPQEVRVESARQKAVGTLEVLGDVVPGQLIVTLKPGVNRDQATQQLQALGYRIIEPFQPLGGSPSEKDNPCSGELGTIDVGGKPLGQALAELEALDIVYRPDPQTDWGFDAVDYLGAISAPAAQSRGRSGKGTTIAVLDTGVNFDRPELGSRLLPGYDFVENDTVPQDDFSNPANQTPLHGTPIAVLAAGAKLGVAPQAQVLPIKVCDKGGQCLASRVVKGVCYALSNAERKTLVLNLSLGGDTPVSVLEAILKFAVAQNVLVVAAGGNQGPDIRDGSFFRAAPRHYPAAYSLGLKQDDGLVAVAALGLNPDTGKWEPASFSTRGVNITYLDIAAPGQDIQVGNFNYQGTSFATPLVAGGLALWREANPTLTPAEIEAKLKAQATALSYTANEVGKGMLNLSSQP